MHKSEEELCMQAARAIVVLWICGFPDPSISNARGATQKESRQIQLEQTSGAAGAQCLVDIWHPKRPVFGDAAGSAVFPSLHPVRVQAKALAGA
jgi:hypothetical protein